MSRAILEPTVFASGIVLFLYAHKQDLSIPSYLAPFPFWVGIGRPLGLLWNQSVLKELNRDVFPPEMKSYKELYLVSRRAIAYDLLFNHIVFNPTLAIIILGYTYAAKKAEEYTKEEKPKSRTFLELLKVSGVKLLQMRVLVSLTSVISEYWLSLLSVRRSKEGVGMNNGAKRLLLLKEMLLTMGWHSYILKVFHETYLYPQ